MIVITESQMRQTLDIVLRELAQAIVQALPEYPKQRLSTFQTGTESGEPLLNGRLLVTVADAAAILSINRSALYRLIMKDQIQSVRIGRSRRVPVSALHEFIARQLQGSM